MIQTKLLIENGVIIGLLLHNKRKKWKTCKWCGHTFMPQHNKQAFCDNICRDISRQKYKSDWMYNRRLQNRNGFIINDRSILNVGTGGLGEHRCKEEEMEYKKIQKEFRTLGLRRRMI